MVFSIDDESTWRVTPENPVREVNGMDWERCAALHNHILRLGWAVNGKPKTEIPRETWWQTHITDPALEAEWSARLSPTLKQFLQAAFENAPDQSFFYYVSGLSFPEQLFGSCHEDEGIMCLYPAANPNMGSHPDGLNFDQETSQAIFHLDILDYSITNNGRTVWDPLEVVLSAWLDMIDTDKIVARSSPVRGPGEGDPWELQPYSQSDLQAAVTYFDNLILKIESLVENPSLQTKDNPEDQAKLIALATAKFNTPRSPDEMGLISTEVLDRAGLKQGFVRDFLTSVRRPKANIKHIAPGLRLPTESDFSPLPLQNLDIPQLCSNPILPIPLFVTDTKSTSPIFERYPLQDLPNLRYGLWTTYVNRDGDHEFEDGCRLFLPFNIGARGFARLADDTLVGEGLESAQARPSGRRNELYQTGYNHYIPWHEPQLGDILNLWQSLVQAGLWEVGEGGVVGGIEKFKEADTEDGSYMYQLIMKW
ncbi:hypothetical protein VE03_03370 [Pseudogymnoascus sp. 23342-1-I1]|nr:hypothetical protein VE03_03370 [Pseudogymnoascus sp. 23342-1-I1]